MVEPGRVWTVPENAQIGHVTLSPVCAQPYVGASTAYICGRV